MPSMYTHIIVSFRSIHQAHQQFNLINNLKTYQNAKPITFLTIQKGNLQIPRSHLEAGIAIERAILHRALIGMVKDGTGSSTVQKFQETTI